MIFVMRTSLNEILKFKIEMVVGKREKTSLLTNCTDEIDENLTQRALHLEVQFKKKKIDDFCKN